MKRKAATATASKTEEHQPETTSSPKKAKSSSAAVVSITSSKACQAFAKRHTELEKAIKKLNPDVAVNIDVQKKISSNPDKGSFIVEVNGKKIVNLVAIPRPFTTMKALDLEKVAKDVVAAL